MLRRTKRVLVMWLLSGIALFGAVRVVVAIPEQCEEPSMRELDESIAETVGWFERNQLENGTWVYRFDTTEGRNLGGYEWVRHAGVLLSLEQAARRAGPQTAESAARVSDAGWKAMFRQLASVRLRERETFGVRGTSSVTGGSALTGIALSERRLRTNDVTLDDRLLGLARFVAEQVEGNGSVLNRVNLATGIGEPGSYSPFVTGQALFLFAQVRAITDSTEFDQSIRAILAYLSTDRAAREGFVPDVSDHWAAYGLAVLEASAPAFLNDRATIEFMRKQLGIVGVQVRYESQRTNSHLNRWTRGRQTLGAGLGTLGEALGEWRRVVPNQPALRDHWRSIDERLVCVAGLLVDRQLGSSESASLPNPQAARGAWTQFGITQMDDQQHALSALLAARDVDLDAPNAPRRAPIPEHAWLVVLLAIVALNPARLVRIGGRCRAVPVGISGVGVIALSSAVGGPMVRALDVSPATAVVGAGCAIVVAAAAALFARERRHDADDDSSLALLLSGYLRPEIVLLSLAIGAGGRGWEWTLTAALVALGVGALGGASARLPAAVYPWASRLATCGAIVLGIALIADGAYAV